MKQQYEHKLMSLSASTRGFLIVFVSSIFGLAAALPAQAEEGVAEKAGQKVDNAAAVAGNKLEATKESVSEHAVKTEDYLGDAAITAKVKAEIFGEPTLKVMQINVTTTNGVVNLSGTVDSQQNIDKALELARNNRNVKAVENGLVVKSVK